MHLDIIYKKVFSRKLNELMLLQDGCRERERERERHRQTDRQTWWIMGWCLMHNCGWARLDGLDTDFLLPGLSVDCGYFSLFIGSCLVWLFSAVVR